MRGALRPLAGVLTVAVTPGNQDFTVLFDPAKVTVETMLVALQAVREPATVRQ